jgi:hypothetical protein
MMTEAVLTEAVLTEAVLALCWLMLGYPAAKASSQGRSRGGPGRVTGLGVAQRIGAGSPGRAQSSSGQA